MASIVTVTLNPSVDIFLEVPHLTPNRKLRCLPPTHVPGGGGINVSRAIQRLGGSSTALYLAGGPTGDELTELLQRESIATNHVPIAEVTRQDVHVVETAGGKEYRLVVPGPEVRRGEWEHLQRALRSIAPHPDIVVASGSLPPGVPVDFYGRLASMAIQENFRLIVDTSGEPLRYAARKGTFLLKPNVHELMNTQGGGEVFSDRFIEGAALAIQSAKGVDIVVVSSGASGALLVDANGARRFSAPVVSVRSRVGAGDSMVAGIVVGLSRGWPIDDAVRYGVAAGSAAVMAPAHSLCSMEQTSLLFAEMTERALVPA